MGVERERDELRRTKNRGRAEKERGIMGEVSKKKKTRRKGNRTKRLPEKAHREKPKMNEKGWKGSKGETEENKGTVK